MRTTKKDQKDNLQPIGRDDKEGSKIYVLCI